MFEILVLFSSLDPWRGWLLFASSWHPPEWFLSMEPNINGSEASHGFKTSMG
jgi:hypothetical protein